MGRAPLDVGGLDEDPPPPFFLGGGGPATPSFSLLPRCGAAVLLRGAGVLEFWVLGEWLVQAGSVRRSAPQKKQRASGGLITGAFAFFLLFFFFFFFFLFFLLFVLSSFLSSFFW